MSILPIPSRNAVIAAEPSSVFDLTAFLGEELVVVMNGLELE